MNNYYSIRNEHLNNNVKMNAFTLNLNYEVTTQIHFQFNYELIKINFVCSINITIKYNIKIYNSIQNVLFKIKKIFAYHIPLLNLMVITDFVFFFSIYVYTQYSMFN